jgi:hypothetical protein
MQTGQVERTIKFEFHFLNFKHRVKDAPVPEVTPNPSELLSRHLREGPWTRRI